jgi:hypothetical protein
MVASVAFAAGKIITAKDLPGLKGTWEGIISFGVFDMGTSPMKLEILNDAVPVKAKLTITNVPDQVAQRYGTKSGESVIENDAGVITSQGTIFWAGAAGNYFELSISKDEKKVGVWYFYKGMKGDGTLKKKK